MVDTRVLDCIRKYVSEKYAGDGLVNVFDVSADCDYSQGTIIKALVVLEELGEVRIEKRYSCPKSHTLRQEQIPFCSECDETYPEELINVSFYFKPLTLAAKG